MGKILVLAEKPSVGREIAKVLNCNQKGNSCLIGSKYIVTWALGHLVTLADPEVYGEQYKKWDLSTLPMLPEKMQLVVIRETSKQFQAVKTLMNSKEVDELVIATDAGREGELVARWIILKAGWRKPIKRLWISSQTERAIKDGFNNLKPSREYDNLFKSAECRSKADWLVGLNVTRALTCKYNAQLSAGRVQTPTLYMIVEREEEIKRFIPKDYWTINANVGAFNLIWQDKTNKQTRTFDKSKADAIVSKINGQAGEIVEISKDLKRELPPLAYDLTELQRDANRKYGFSAKQTLNTMQRLYENHKLLTYPRTDSRYLTTDIVPTLPERLKSIAVGPYAEKARAILKGKINATKRLVDNSKVSDHHAIIPTEQYVNLMSLNNDERKIYDLVVKRFLAVLSSPFEYEQTTVNVNIKGEAFYAKGKIVKSKGWKSVYDSHNGSELEDFDEDSEKEIEDREQSLPELKKGQSLKVNSARSVNGKTKPPSRYTEATLLSAMEHPGKFVDDRNLRETLDNTSGLGTPATRADIIEKLFNTFYIERKGKELFPTSKAVQLINLVPNDLKSPELTAKWEQQLNKISKGMVNGDKFILEMRDYATSLVKNVTNSTQNFKHDNVSREKCPQCGKYLLNVKGKKGDMLVCQDRECGYRKSTSQLSNARCPECHKKMELHGEGDGKIFTCKCGYREKLSAFNKRRESEKSNLSKKDVNKYLKTQKDEPINNALAEALAKWKKD